MAWSVPENQLKNTFFDVDSFEAVVQKLAHRASACCAAIDYRLYSISEGMPVLDGILTLLQSEVLRIAGKYVDMDPSNDYAGSNYTTFPIYLVPARVQHYVPDICTVPEDAGVFNDGTRDAIDTFLNACSDVLDLCKTVVVGKGWVSASCSYAESREVGLQTAEDHSPASGSCSHTRSTTVDYSYGEENGEPDGSVGPDPVNPGVCGYDQDDEDNLVVSNRSPYGCRVSAVLQDILPVNFGPQVSYSYRWDPYWSGSVPYSDYSVDGTWDDYRTSGQHARRSAGPFELFLNYTTYSVYFKYTLEFLTEKHGITCHDPSTQVPVAGECSIETRKVPVETAVAVTGKPVFCRTCCCENEECSPNKCAVSYGSDYCAITNRVREELQRRQDAIHAARSREVYGSYVSDVVRTPPEDWTDDPSASVYYTIEGSTDSGNLVYVEHTRQRVVYNAYNGCAATFERFRKEDCPDGTESTSFSQLVDYCPEYSALTADMYTYVYNGAAVPFLGIIGTVSSSGGEVRVDYGDPENGGPESLSYTVHTACSPIPHDSTTPSADWYRRRLPRMSNDADRHYTADGSEELTVEWDAINDVEVISDSPHPLNILFQTRRPPNGWYGKDTVAFPGVLNGRFEYDLGSLPGRSSEKYDLVSRFKDMCRSAATDLSSETYAQYTSSRFGKEFAIVRTLDGSSVVEEVQATSAAYERSASVDMDILFTFTFDFSNVDP